MDTFINRDFMLTNDTAHELYECGAEDKPIIDYHCHLDPRQIADNHRFDNLSDIWLGGDHYKWRAMRGNGIPEEFITGKRSGYEKFEKWAETVPYTMCNPLYHWTHLELSRIFNVNKTLNPRTAREIYDECSAKLRTEEYRARAIMERCNVEVVCTTDDPSDSLEHHERIRRSDFSVKVLPTWRPDKVMAVGNPETYKAYIRSLGESADMEIRRYADLRNALLKRHDFFASMGCKLSDHGLDTFYAYDYTEAELERIFSKIISGKSLDDEEIRIFKSGILFDLAVMDAEKDWTQQFHIGVIRNNNSRMFKLIGADTGYDAILDVPCARAGHKFFDRLNMAGKLAKTILYNLNPKDNEVLATMAYTFNDGSVAGKMQLGAAWWFLDQEDGMRKQMKTLASLGLLSRFVGMLTDSRSFLSYPRHEYFRRILCNMIGEEVERGSLPAGEMPFITQMVADISYYNAKRYFDF